MKSRSPSPSDEAQKAIRASTGNSLSCMTENDVSHRLFLEFIGNVDSNWTEAGRRIFEG